MLDEKKVSDALELIPEEKRPALDDLRPEGPPPWYQRVSWDEAIIDLGDYVPGLRVRLTDCDQEASYAMKAQAKHVVHEIRDEDSKTWRKVKVFDPDLDWFAALCMAYVDEIILEVPEGEQEPERLPFAKQLPNGSHKTWKEWAKKAKEKPFDRLTAGAIRFRADQEEEGED